MNTLNSKFNQSLKFPSLFRCDCSSSEHQILFDVDPDGGLVFCHIHLAKRPFLKRIKYGLKYIFGYHCRYGHWEEFIWNPQDAPDLRSLADMLEFQQNLKKTIEQGFEALDKCKIIYKPSEDSNISL